MESILWFVIIGIVAGFLPGLLMKFKGFGLFLNLIVGILGALLGGWLFGVLGLSFGGGLLGSLLTAFFGAVILLYSIKLLKKA